MDFGLSESQEMLRKASREFLEKECPRNLVRDMEEDERGYSLDLWNKMAELDWMGLVFPSQYGGAGGSFLDLTILLEEMGRAFVATPFVPSVVCIGLPILYYGTEEQRSQLLPKIAKGEIVATLASNEAGTRFDGTGIEAQAIKRRNGNYVINAVKLFVPYAHVSNWYLCVAKAKEGPTLFIINAETPRIICSPLRTIASDKQCEVIFDKVMVPQTNILGELGKAGEIVSRIQEWGAMAQCALILGGSQRALEIAASYAEQRVQFGRPIGSFQAVQFMCSDMLTEIDGLRLITYKAAWKLSQGLPATMEVSVAKAWASDTSRRVSFRAMQVMGGAGALDEHEMQLYFRRSKAMELAFGDSDLHRQIIAKNILAAKSLGLNDTC